MNKVITHGLIMRELGALKTCPYQSLQELIGKPMSKNVIGPDGKEYQLSVEAVWDGDPGGDLRVIVSVDDKGWKALFPINSSFIMSPTGEVVG